MAKVDFAANNLFTNTAAPAPNAEKPRAAIWANLGVEVDVPNTETGEMEKTFIALPFGLPIDTMQAVEIRGSNTNWNNMAAAKNSLLDSIKEIAEGIGAGEAEILEGLQVQLRRVGEPSAAVQDEASNPFLSAMRNSLTVVK